MASLQLLSIKWNNEKLPYFSPRRGLRQGDPLSPSSYYAWRNWLFSSKRKSLMVFDFQLLSPGMGHKSHIFFSLMIAYCLPKPLSLKLNWFRKSSAISCLASGLKVNIQKSKFFCSKNVKRSKIN